MPPIRPCELPRGALLERYRRDGSFTDCYVAQAPGRVSQAQFVEAFYTSAAFKPEQMLLTLLVARPSSDDDARELAAGARENFAAWRVEDRNAGQLLLADFTGRTRSWLMAAPIDADAPDAGTLLYFGSAVVPRRRTASNADARGGVFGALLGFHKAYSRILLTAARARACRRRAATGSRS